ACTRTVSPGPNWGTLDLNCSSSRERINWATMMPDPSRYCGLARCQPILVFSTTQCDVKRTTTFPAARGHRPVYQLHPHSVHNRNLGSQYAVPTGGVTGEPLSSPSSCRFRRPIVNGAYTAA